MRNPLVELDDLRLEYVSRVDCRSSTLVFFAAVILTRRALSAGGAAATKPNMLVQMS